MHVIQYHILEGRVTLRIWEDKYARLGGGVGEAVRRAGCGVYDFVSRKQTNVRCWHEAPRVALP